MILRVLWHFSLVQRCVKNGQSLTVKGMVIKWWNFISEVTNCSYDTQEDHGLSIEFHQNWKVKFPVQMCTWCEIVSNVI